MGLGNIKNSLKCDRGEAIVLYLGRWKSNKACKKPEDRLKPFYYGYKGCASTLLQYINVPLTASICVTDDFGLQMIKLLQTKGYKNFTLMITDSDIELAERFVYYIKRAWKEEDLKGVDIKRIEECRGMKFDLIISNPPYEMGNDITRRLIDEIEFDEFINLMPLSKYKKGSLYKYIITRCDHMNWWEQAGNSYDSTDALTSPIICLLQDKPNNLDYFTFELNYIYDQRLKHYYQEQLGRVATFSQETCRGNREDGYPVLNSHLDWICGIYTPAVLQKNGVTQLEGNKISLEAFMRDPYANSRCRYYVWNFLKPNMKVQDCFEPVGLAGTISQTITHFQSEIEKDNFLKWWHSAEFSGRYCKSGLSTILLRALNKPTSCPFDFILPRVDWTREWTDEEILRDYGYSSEEIEEILHYNDDLIPKGWKA